VNDYRLRQMIALLKDCNLDFEALLKGLLHWNSDQKRTQNQWARDFYRNLNHENETETATQKEGNE
jgi:CRISPR system Cascade subunit CasB